VPDPLIHGDGHGRDDGDDGVPSPVPEPPAGAGLFVAQARRPAADPTSPQPAPAADPTSPQPARSRRAAGVIPGGVVVPAPLLAELIRRGAKVRLVQQPGCAGEPGYRPSTGLAEFVRARDVTCRFPGCDRPAQFSDIDHTIAWPGGPTHPGNTKCYCRSHHLVKTLWGGRGGWSDRQFPDGRVVVTTPAGLTYTTWPGSVLLFPGWSIDTPVPRAGPPPTGVGPPGNDVRSFARKRTRAQNRQNRITAEREYNAARIAENAEPPPF
jgi:hypothetical protein